MVKRKFDKNQSKLGVKTLDLNVPKNHISRFVVEFIEDVFPLLEIDGPKKKKGRISLPIDYMLKLLVYAKIQHIDGTSIIETWQGIMTFLNMFVVIFDLLNVQFKGIEENTVVISKYYLQMTLKKAFDEGFMEFNHVAIGGTIKKAYNSNNNTITKKETQY